MAKKTKEEKIVATYRKKLRLLSQLDQTPIPSTNQIIENKKDIRAVTGLQEKTHKTPVEGKKIEINAEDFSRKKFFLEDLKKSLFLISFIITLEIVIYFVTINRIFTK